MRDPSMLAADAEAAVDALSAHSATWTPSWGAAAQNAPVIFGRADQGFGGESVTAAELSMRWAATQLTGLRENEIVTIGGASYRLREPPRDDNGIMSAALMAYQT